MEASSQEIQNEDNDKIRISASSPAGDKKCTSFLEKNALASEKASALKHFASIYIISNGLLLWMQKKLGIIETVMQQWKALDKNY